MEYILCLLGFHKWSFESKMIPKHKREQSKHLFDAMFYGSSKFYQYECERCDKKQWYAIGTTLFDGYYKRKINLDLPTLG